MARREKLTTEQWRDRFNGFELRILGGLSMGLPNSPQFNFPFETRDTQVLANIALNHNVGISRREIIESIWPDMDYGGNNLSVQLIVIQRKFEKVGIPNSVIWSEGDRNTKYSICPYLAIDEVMFRKMAIDVLKEEDGIEKVRRYILLIPYLGKTLLADFDERIIVNLHERRALHDELQSRVMRDFYRALQNCGRGEIAEALQSGEIDLSDLTTIPF